MYNNLQKHYPGFLFFAKVLILVLAYRLVSERILDASSYQLLFENLRDLKAWALPVAAALFAMTTLNWTLEVVKWKRLASRIVPISFREALKQSLSSLTVSLITPNRIGEYGAKALYFQGKERSRVLLYNFIGNFTQMGATLLFGFLGLWWVQGQVSELGLGWIPWWKMGLLLSVLLVGALIAGKTKNDFIPRLLNKLKKTPGDFLGEIFLLSLLKYLVFAHQFYFLLLVFGVELDYLLCMSLIGISYLVASLIPGFVLFDWLVKGSVAVTVFSRFGVDDILVLSVTSLMWILNFGLPSLLGSFYVILFRRPALKAQKSRV